MCSLRRITTLSPDRVRFEVLVCSYILGSELIRFTERKEISWVVGEPGLGDSSNRQLMYSLHSRLWPAPSRPVNVIIRLSLPPASARECWDGWKEIPRGTLEAVVTWTCCRFLCSDDVPGYGEDGSQSTPVTRSDKQEHDGKPRQHVPGRPYKSRGSALIRGCLQHQEPQGVERAVPQWSVSLCSCLDTCSCA